MGWRLLSSFLSPVTNVASSEPTGWDGDTNRDIISAVDAWVPSPLGGMETLSNFNLPTQLETVPSPLGGMETFSI